MPEPQSAIRESRQPLAVTVQVRAVGAHVDEQHERTAHRATTPAPRAQHRGSGARAREAPLARRSRDANLVNAAEALLPTYHHSGGSQPTSSAGSIPAASTFGSTKRFLGLRSKNDSAICVASQIAGGKQTRPRSSGASSGIGSTG